MARQVLPIVGAVAGFVISGGNPYGAQVGFAVGSLIGNAVDPIEMQGRKLGDAPTQVAAEGGARAIVYGKGCIRATVVIERGGRRVIRQRDRSGGKGGGPTTINERALWTFAIALGEPVAGLLRIWENEKLVYDVTPESTIPEDTEQFAEKFRFYTGAEDQLPDPALEALHGVGNTPYYRGTAYMVFPQYDLTDFGETVPTYRVEVAAEVDGSMARNVIVLGQQALGDAYRISHSADAQTWDPDTTAAPTIIDTYVDQALGVTDSFVSYGNGSIYRSTDETGAVWNEIYAFGSVIGGSLTGGTNGDVVLIPRSFQGVMRISQNFTVFELITSIDCSCAAFNGLGVAMSVYVGDSNVNVSPASSGSSWVAGPAHGLDLSGGMALCGLTDTFALGARSGGAPAMVFINSAASTSPHVFPGTGRVTCLVSRVVSGEEITLAGLSTGQVWKTTDRVNWSLTSYTPGASQFPWSMDHNGTQFIVGSRQTDGTAQVQTSPDGDDWEVQTQPIARNLRAVAALYPTTPEIDGDKVALSAVVSAVHDRCGSEEYDVSELTELISGVVIESTVTAAEAINSIIGSHFADPSDYDGQIHYIKRGKPVVLTLTEDDLIDEPDEAQRNNAIEYPKKVHFLGQRADLAYASSKSTSARYSDDARVVGEITIGSPETYDDGTEPAEVAVKLHKVLWTEAEGEREWLIPDNYLELVPTDNVGLSYRGELVRCRILNIEDTPGQRKLRMIRDRQSAYTANLTEIPNPPSPTPPQSSVVAPTVMAFIDTSALTDNADTLHYLVALSGANDNWAGAALQQLLGGNYTTIDSTTLNAVMGTTQNTVPDASPYYTDTTNEVVVNLFTDDELESRTEAEFLSNGGAFFLSWDDSGTRRWEIMQFRDAVQDSSGNWVLSHLMRGRKNTETAEHPSGSMFVWIDPAILREAAQTSWIDTVLTHRAVSNGLSPELATPQNNLYEGNSQREWPVANLLLSRPDADTVDAEAIPRHRFGTSMNPIRSVNWEGYRWVVTDGSNTINRDGTSATESFDTTGWGSPVSVTVAQLNRLTGAGPTVSEEIV